MNIQVYTIWNMPWKAVDAITKASDGYQCHHVAIQFEEWVLDAVIPRVKMRHVDEYQKHLDKMARNWRYRFNRDPLAVHQYQFFATSDQTIKMLIEAARWKGTRYGLIRNYFRGGPRVHCSEFVGRVLMAGEIAHWDIEPSKIRPIDIHMAMHYGDTVKAIQSNRTLMG